MTDVLLDKVTNDIAIKNGDFAIGVTDQQNQKLLLICGKSSFKQFPTVCVGAASFLESADEGDFVREVRDQFIGDGMKVNSIAITGGKLTVDSNY